VSEKLKESLSAAVDDETDEFELRRVLDEARDTPLLQQSWDRYHLIGALLRSRAGDRPVNPSHLRAELMRERMWAALDAESPELPAAAGFDNPQPDAPTQAPTPPPQLQSVTGGGAAAAPRSPWLGPLTGLAVAASVAFAVVIGLNGLGGPADPPTPAPVAIQIDTPVVPDPAASPEVSERDVRRANAYMMHHAQMKALNQTGVMNFAKMAAYSEP